MAIKLPEKEKCVSLIFYNRFFLLIAKAHMGRGGGSSRGYCRATVTGWYSNMQG
jgi:hypothetical protein